MTAFCSTLHYLSRTCAYSRQFKEVLEPGCWSVPLQLSALYRRHNKPFVFSASWPSFIRTHAHTMSENENGGREKAREPLQQWWGSLMALGICENIFNLFKAGGEWKRRQKSRPGRQREKWDRGTEMENLWSFLFCLLFYLPNLVINLC